jgi:hypothetical protein
VRRFFGTKQLEGRGGICTNLVSIGEGIPDLIEHEGMTHHYLSHEIPPTRIFGVYIVRNIHYYEGRR